jgi:putative tryptophan/tyrosine transport system substrate-binding protein
LTFAIIPLHHPGMDRRRFLLSSLAGALATPRSADAQSPGRIPRVGVLATEFPEAFRQSLRELGYIERQNVMLEIRETKGRADRVDAFANELARLNVDVLVGTNPAAVFGARRATGTIPIVMVYTPDPVQLGLVASLARPGGNITGVTSLSRDVSVKQVELLREAVPRASRIAMLWNPDSPWHALVVKALREEERKLGVPIYMLQVQSPDELDSVFQTLVRDRTGAALALADPVTYAHRSRLADLATRHRIPVMGGLRAYTEAGCLMSYWADERELYRRAATYVDRILKGASPASLPIEQPTTYQLIVNLKTAKTLRLTIPPSLLARADQVIE